MSLLDAYGRPVTKEEIEHVAASAPAKKFTLMPAMQAFQDVYAQSGYEEYGGIDPFVAAGETGHYRDDSEVRADYAAPLTNTWGINDRFAHQNPISQLSIPGDTRGVMSLSLRHAQSNYIVSRSIRVKRNFALRDLQFLGKETTREFYRTEFRRLKMRALLAHVFRYYWITGRAVVFWGDERPIQRIVCLDPRFILVRRVLGTDIVFMVPDPRWQSILEAANENPAQKLQASFLKKNLPAYWMPFIRRGEPIPLKDDSYALIENDLEQFNGRGVDAPGNVPLQPIFSDLAIMDMMVAGDFSVAWMMKHLIALVSIGDPAKEKDYTPPNQTDLANLQRGMQRPDGAFVAFVDPTVDWRWISPDPKLFDQAKYKQRAEAIEYTMGVPAVFSNPSGNFAAGSLSLKPFREEIETGRLDVAVQLFSKLFPIMREGYVARKAGTKDPEVSFDTDCLKDDRVLTDELNGKYDRGAVSIRSLLEGKAQDFDTEVARKLEEIKMQDKDERIFAPAFDVSHGTVDGGEGGRPATGSTPQSESSQGQTPRPSRPT